MIFTTTRRWRNTTPYVTSGFIRSVSRHLITHTYALEWSTDFADQSELSDTTYNEKWDAEKFTINARVNRRVNAINPAALINRDICARMWEQFVNFSVLTNCVYGDCMWLCSVVCIRMRYTVTCAQIPQLMLCLINLMKHRVTCHRLLHWRHWCCLGKRMLWLMYFIKLSCGWSLNIHMFTAAAVTYAVLTRGIKLFQPSSMTQLK